MQDVSAYLFSKNKGYIYIHIYLYIHSICASTYMCKIHILNNTLRNHKEQRTTKLKYQNITQVHQRPVSNLFNEIFRDPQYWDPFPILFPYHSHMNPQRYGNSMGIVWAAYHKGVPVLGVPEITLNLCWLPLALTPKI